MSSGVTIKVNGLASVIKQIRDKERDVKDQLSVELQASAQEIAEQAAVSAPVDNSVLKNGITSKEVDQLNFEVVSQADYSAFVEFGTKTKVSIPPGLEQYAAQFRGQKSYGDAKKMIFDWCKRKGIAEENWYPIYRSIMVNGISPKPFFFKQLEKEGPALVKRLKNLL